MMSYFLDLDMSLAPGYNENDSRVGRDTAKSRIDEMANDCGCQVANQNGTVYRFTGSAANVSIAAIAYSVLVYDNTIEKISETIGRIVILPA